MLSYSLIDIVCCGNEQEDAFSVSSSCSSSEEEEEFGHQKFQIPLIQVF